ncbi:MAG: sel1 repeat family protein, partial [Magnetococcus sp. YQC-5]
GREPLCRADHERGRNLPSAFFACSYIQVTESQVISFADRVNKKFGCLVMILLSIILSLALIVMVVSINETTNFFFNDFFLSGSGDNKAVTLMMSRRSDLIAKGEQYFLAKKEAGNHEADLILGDIYSNLFFSRYNLKKAALHYRCAYINGIDEAGHQYALSLYKGWIDGKKDLEYAVHLFKRSIAHADQNHFYAMHYITKIYIELGLPGNHARNVINYLTKYAAAGDVNAAQQLGDVYYYGEYSTEQNDNLAFWWYSRAAISGDNESQYQLAKMYHYGRGVEMNYIKSIYWLIVSWFNGDAVASRAILKSLKYGQLTFDLEIGD